MTIKIFCKTPSNSIAIIGEISMGIPPIAVLLISFLIGFKSGWVREFIIAAIFIKVGFCIIIGLLLPNEMKIVYGDNWLIYQSKKNKRKNYRINGQQILHIGSLSSSNKALKPICKVDSKIYKKHTMTLAKRLFSYEENWDCFKLRLLGLTFKIKKAGA